MPGTAQGTLIDGTPTNGANLWIDSLVGGWRWTDADGGTTTISYATVQGNYTEQATGPSIAWTIAGEVAVQRALAAWEAVANIDFVPTSALGADMQVWALHDNQISDPAFGTTYGFADFPGVDSEPDLVRFNFEPFNPNELLPVLTPFQVTTLEPNPPGPAREAYAPGSYAFETMLHEFGHDLGLAHPHDGGGQFDGTLFPGVLSAADFGFFNLNQSNATVMSYNFSGFGEGGGVDPNNPDFNLLPDAANISDLSTEQLYQTYGYAATPMALDIAAIQAIYGANTTYNSGNNNYFLPRANLGDHFETIGVFPDQVVQFVPAAAWRCIWDTGGTDTIIGTRN